MTFANDENEVAELWREYRRAQQQRRENRLPGRQQEIEALSRSGFSVVRLTDYQFRVDGKLDLYPIHKRFHHIPSNRRGKYTSAREIAFQKLREGRTT